MSSWQPQAKGNQLQQHVPAAVQQVLISSRNQPLQQATMLGSKQGGLSANRSECCHNFGGHYHHAASAHTTAPADLTQRTRNHHNNDPVTNPYTPLQPAQHTPTHSSPNFTHNTTPPTPPAQLLHSAFPFAPGMDAAPSNRTIMSHGMSHPKGFGPNLLEKLQHLTASLAVSAQLLHIHQIHACLQLLSSFPVTTQLLVSSQAAVTVRQVLQQLQQQCDGKHGRVLLLLHGCQLLKEVTQDAQQLLQQWRAVLRSELTAAASNKVLESRQILQDPPAAVLQSEPPTTDNAAPSQKCQKTRQQHISSRTRSKQPRRQQRRQHAKRLQPSQAVVPSEAAAYGRRTSKRKDLQDAPAAATAQVGTRQAKRRKQSSNQQHRVVPSSRGFKAASPTVGCKQRQIPTGSCRRSAAAAGVLSSSFAVTTAGKKRLTTSLPNAQPVKARHSITQPLAQPMSADHHVTGVQEECQATANDQMMVQAYSEDVLLQSGKRNSIAASMPYTVKRTRARKSKFTSRTAPVDGPAASGAAALQSHHDLPVVLNESAGVAVKAANAVAGDRVNLSADMTNISTASHVGINQHQRATTAAAGPESMWGTGAVALRAAHRKGPDHRKRNQHQKAQHQSPYGHGGQMKLGTADVEDVNNRSQGVCLARPIGSCQQDPTANAATPDRARINNSLEMNAASARIEVKAGVAPLASSAGVAAHVHGTGASSVGDGGSGGLVGADDLLVEVRKLGGWVLGMPDLVLSPELQ